MAQITPSEGTAAAKPNGTCYCRCGMSTGPGRYFAQGHDRRAATVLAAIENPERPIIDRLVAAGFVPGGRDLRAEALASGTGYRECEVPGCQVYGRGAGMFAHESREHA